MSNVFAQNQVTTDCRITKHIVGLVNPDNDINFGPSLAILDWKIQIEWKQIGEGGICKLWLIKDDGRILIDRWSSTKSLSLYKMNDQESSNQPLTVYALADDNFIFFQIIVDSEGNAYCHIETKER